MREQQRGLNHGNLRIWALPTGVQGLSSPSPPLLMGRIAATHQEEVWAPWQDLERGVGRTGPSPPQWHAQDSAPFPSVRTLRL